MVNFFKTWTYTLLKFMSMTQLRDFFVVFGTRAVCTTSFSRVHYDFGILWSRDPNLRNARRGSGILRRIGSEASPVQS